jgi:hypothetical protein
MTSVNRLAKLRAMPAREISRGAYACRLHSHGERAAAPARRAGASRALEGRALVPDVWQHADWQRGSSGAANAPPLFFRHVRRMTRITRLLAEYRDEIKKARRIADAVPGTRSSSSGDVSFGDRSTGTPTP